jgi:hypothetical protein
MSEMASVNDPVTGRFLSGNPSAHRMRQRAKEAIKADLIAAYDFAALSVFLPVIVEHLYDASHARSKVDRTRAANTANRLLAEIPRKAEKPARTLGEILGGK